MKKKEYDSLIFSSITEEISYRISSTVNDIILDMKKEYDCQLPRPKGRGLNREVQRKS